MLEPRRNAINSDNSNNTNNGGNSTGKNTNNGGGSSNEGTDRNNGSRNGMDEGLFGTNGNSYEQMVRNGLVNDTDGDLTDGENPHS